MKVSMQLSAVEEEKSSLSFLSINCSVRWRRMTAPVWQSLPSRGSSALIVGFQKYSLLPSSTEERYKPMHDAVLAPCCCPWDSKRRRSLPCKSSLKNRCKRHCNCLHITGNTRTDLVLCLGCSEFSNSKTADLPEETQLQKTHHSLNSSIARSFKPVLDLTGEKTWFFT